MYKNKKGSAYGIIFFFLILFVILILGFIISTGTGVINYVVNETVPLLTDFGMVETVNLTEIADQTIVPANNIFQNINWFIGVIYFMMLIASIGFAVYSRITPEKWLLGLYFLLMILLIMGAILISNMYEEFSTGAGEFAPYLQSQTLMNFLIIQAPLIFTIIGFITMIIIFSGAGREVTA